MVTDALTGAGILETFGGRIADRRKRQRAVVEWPLRLWRAHQHVLDSYTVNVSSRGLYCCSPQPFSPGEALVGVLEIPGLGAQFESRKLLLRCELLVMRVDLLATAAIVELPAGSSTTRC